MIQIEIISSPDRDVISSFQFFQNVIYLGRSAGNVTIKDSDLKASHLMIEVVEKDLIVHPQKDVEFYLIEGKRSSTVRKIKTGQALTIGSTTLKVTAFEETHYESKKAVLESKLSKLMESESLRMPVIEKLTKLMK